MTSTLQRFLTKDLRPEEYYSVLSYKAELRPIKRSESIRIYQGGELLDSGGVCRASREARALKDHHD
ncbi:hypothetical protein [Vibrio phage J14]|nr:hypothetical protein [Vibrio phage J14]